MPTEMIDEKNSDGSPNPIENESTADRVRLEQIVTGGQAGVDRAALDAARDAGIPAGGWCPKGRIAIDGRIPDIYALQETPSADYAERTTWNVRDSDGTLVLIVGDPTGGTAFTIDVAKRLGRPCLVIDPESKDIEKVRSWMRQHDVRILNVAGPREYPPGGIYDRTYAFMRELLSSRERSRPVNRL